MKILHDLFKKNEYLFHKGGKFEKFFPLYEATESFCFTPKTVTQGSVHVRDGLDSKRLMMWVVLALVPCVLLGAYNVGLQTALANQADTSDALGLFIEGMIKILPIIVVSYAVGGIWETLFSVVRGHEINEGFLVTGLLFPLTLPPTIPLWQVAVGISFGVVIGKEVFGGTGMNVLNPALTARAFLYFSYPVQISGDKVWIAHGNQVVDGFSGATPLGILGSHDPSTSSALEILQEWGKHHSNLHYDMNSMFMGLIPGSIGETSVLACLIGAAILIITGVGSWRVMASVIIGTAATAAFINGFATDALSPMLKITAMEHLVMGGLFFGLVFMATDPVSASRTNTGKWIYGFLIGMLTVLIRVFNPAYPEGAMLAILFMNIFAPLIDHFVVNTNIKRRLKRVAA